MQMTNRLFKFCTPFLGVVMAIVLWPAVLHAQNSLESGISGGYSYYNGDIVPGAPFVMPKTAYGALIRYNYGHRWSAKITYTHAKVAGDDAKTQAVANRNLHFITIINDVSLTGEFNFMEYFTGSKKHKFTPYLTAGAGFFFYKPTSDWNGQVVDLRSIGTEGQIIHYDGRKPYKKYNFAAIFGLGFKFSLSKRFGLSAEWRMHKTFTDYLDDVSTTYYLDGPSLDPTNLTEHEYLSDPTLSHTPGEQRGNSGTKDWFGIANVSVTYKIEFNTKKGCKNLQW
jgi:hypothetical protein